jgi:N-acetylglucosamine-6-phosphate deacetylase
MLTLFFDGKIFTPENMIHRGAVIVSDDGKIDYAGPVETAPHVDGSKLDLRGLILIPGLIDVHVHGGNGVNFLGPIEGILEGLEKYSQWVIRKGVTGYLCSIAAPDHHSLIGLIKAYVIAFENEIIGAEPLGLHLEGPYLNKKEKKGAFNPEWLRDPSVREVDDYIRVGKGWIRQMTIDPELPHANEVAAFLRRANVVVAFGHSNLKYNQASEALRGDYTHVTHTFNAQSGFGHRAPGVFGAVLASDQVTTELIADEIHVHPGAMKVLVRCVGKERVVLITDAMAGAGFGDGTYEIVGNTVNVKGNIATLENGTLAGSISTLDQCVSNMVKDVNVPLNEAVQMASLNAARSMGLANWFGSIEVSKEANMVIIDEDMNIFLTMVKGKVVYNKLEMEFSST